jgi:hypothetical protein
LKRAYVLTLAALNTVLSAKK